MTAIQEVYNNLKGECFSNCANELVCSPISVQAQATENYV